MCTDGQNRSIYYLRELGMSYESIGIKFHMSSTSAKKIYKQEKEKITKESKHKKDPANEANYRFVDALHEVCDNSLLVTRIFMCLYRVGIIDQMTRYNITLDSYDDDTLLLIRNFGVNSLRIARRANKIYKIKMEMLDNLENANA